MELLYLVSQGTKIEEHAIPGAFLAILLDTTVFTIAGTESLWCTKLPCFAKCTNL